MGRDGRRHPCLAAEAHPHGLVDRGDSTVASSWDKVIDDPVCAFRADFSKSFTCPLCATTGCYVPQLQLIVVYTPVVAESLIPMAFLFSRPLRFPCCRTHGGRCPCCVGRASSTGAVGEETVTLPLLHLLRTSLEVVNIPVVAQRQFPMVLLNIEIPQFHFDKVIDVPVVQVVRAPQVASWRVTIVLPRLHLLRNSLRAAHRLRDELKWGFYTAPSRLELISCDAGEHCLDSLRAGNERQR